MIIIKRNNKNVKTKKYQKGNQKFLAMHIAYQIEKIKSEMITSTKIQFANKRNMTITIHNVQKNMLKTPKERFSYL